MPQSPRSWSNSCPAGPMNGMPALSSSAPGASAIKHKIGLKIASSHNGTDSERDSPQRLQEFDEGI